MSEKRFTIETFCDGDTEYKCLFDNEKEKEILSDDGFWFEERYSDVVDKLNKLSDENEQLRHELDSLTGCYCADNKEFKDYWRIGYDD